MDRALVVLSESDTGKELLGEAAELAAGVGAELVCLSVLTEEEYDHDIDVLTMLDQAEGTTSHGGGRSFEGEGREELARNEGERLARPVLGETGVDYEIVGQVVSDGIAEAVVDAATDADCDHVFLVGNRRSPVGKAVFGDVAQTVILDFDGPVTVQVE
jgi:nucleotide-binding universal stress UspA family protein